MKKFSFIVLKKDKAELPNGVLVECEAAEWDEIVASEKITGDVLDVSSFKVFLQNAYCMFGHTFNIDRHSPRQLYEAIICSGTYQVLPEGDIPDNPLEYEELPPGVCD